MDTSAPMSARKIRLLAAGLLLATAIAVAFVSPRFLKGTLLPTEIAFALKDRADLDEDGTLSAREVRRTLAQIVRGVNTRQAAYDINQDGYVNRGDIQDSVQAFKALLNAVCGNSETEAGEQCDDGNTNNDDQCDNMCHGTAVTPPLCDEQCIEANIAAIIDRNHDGTVTHQEVQTTIGIIVDSQQASAYQQQYDVNRDLVINSVDAQLVSEYAINHTVCGDHAVEVPEQCDDGNLNNTDSCTNLCRSTTQVTCDQTCINTNIAAVIDQDHNGTVRTEEVINIGTHISNLQSQNQYDVTYDFNLDGLNDAQDVLLLNTYAGTIAICGNNTIQYPEQCDDGNADTSDQCSNLCLTNQLSCDPARSTENLVAVLDQNNDGVMTPQEVHNIGQHISNLHANGPYDVAYDFNCDGLNDPQDILLVIFYANNNPICGNNVTQSPEQCDDGNTDNNDQCNNLCQIPVQVSCDLACADANILEVADQNHDGIVTKTEIMNVDFYVNQLRSWSQYMVAYDFNEDNAVDSQDNAYLMTFANTPGRQICGTGTVNMGEQCDDGDNENGDGCSDVCSVEADYSCNGSPSMCTTQASNDRLIVTSNYVPSRQVLGGTTSDSILSLRFAARGDDMDVTKVQIILEGIPMQPTFVDRLELRSDSGFSAYATRQACDNPYAVSGGDLLFCANLDQHEFIVPQNQVRELTVHALMKPDTDGGVTSQKIIAKIDGNLVTGMSREGMIRARTVHSNNDVLLNDNDSDTNDSEIVIAFMNGTSNSMITGSTNVTTLSGIASIENASPDGEVSNGVPTGPGVEIGRFRFTAAENNNTQNGPNYVRLNRIFFTVSADNVTLQANSFRVVNVTDDDLDANCTPYSPEGVAQTGDGNGNVIGLLYVDCVLQDTNIPNTIAPNASEVYALLANVTHANYNPPAASRLQVFLDSVANPAFYFPTSIFNIYASHLEWSDVDVVSQNPLPMTWANTSQATVFSTNYQSAGQP